MKKKVLKNMEWGIVICSVILLAIGMVALFSASQSTDYDSFIKQGQWILVSIPVLIIVTMVDYNFIAKLSPYFYGIFIILLIAVLFTEPINGATSWFDIGGASLQPGELSKVFVILFLSYVLCKLQERGKKEINKFWKLAVSLLIVMVPVLLIVKQPDYGTAMAFIMATVFIYFIAGIRTKYIVICLLLLAIILPLVYIFVLPEHAKTRIEIFLDPEKDARGAGYNVIQSKLAIGAGQLFGMGLLKGNQTQLGFLYPKTTDFIFSVIGEEMGFIVSSLVIILYVILVTKAVYVAKTAKDDLGSYIAMGIAGIFFFHMIENIGMTMGLLPITGIPLPFVSYGGSAMVTNFICLGLLLNISGRRQKAIFAE